MKHVINVLLLGMVLLGIAMMVDTPWGLGVALAPFAIWGGRFLLLVHKSIWASFVFWAGIAYFHWQAAVAVGVLFGLSVLIKSTKAAHKEAAPFNRRKRTKSAEEFQNSYDYDQRHHIGAGDE